MSSTRCEVYTVGLLHRRNFRVFLRLHRIPYFEEKGLLSSYFIVDVTPEQLRLLERMERNLDPR